MGGRMLVVVNARSGRLSTRQKSAALSAAFSRHGLDPDIRIVHRFGPYRFRRRRDALRVLAPSSD